MLHFAIETSLGLRDAFWSLIAGGRDITQFGTRDGVKDFYPANALHSECIVGILQLHLRTGQSEIGSEELSAAQRCEMQWEFYIFSARRRRMG